jgi:hypothetical protein
MSLSKPLML